MKKRFTAKTIENLKAPDGKRISVFDELTPGFGVRISKSGRKSWFLVYRLHSQQHRLTLGHYPLLSLADARAKAHEALKLVELGIDPAEKKAEENKPPDFLNVVEQFIELYAKPKNRTWKEADRILRKHVAPHFKNMRIEDITRRDVVKMLDTFVARGSSTQANRVLAQVRKMLNWCADRGIIEQSPIAGLEPPARNVARDRVLTDDEIVAFWRTCESFDWPFGTIFRLLLLTGQRRGEVAAMRWSQIDFKSATWVIPREIAKNNRTHNVPLSQMALKLLQTTPSIDDQDYIFSTTGKTPVSGYGHLKARFDDACGFTGWRIHDLRRTAASGMARLGIAPHVVEKILNHSSGIISGVAAVYNRYGYDDEKRLALEAWGEQVEQLVSS